MNTIRKYINRKQSELNEVIKSTDFSRALLGTLAMLIPVVVGIRFNLIEYFIPFTCGVLLATPSDTRGSFRLKSRGILFSAIISGLTVFIIGIFKSSHYLLIPVIGMLTFGISYISIYGFRASLAGFSGLMALVFALSNLTDRIPFWEASLMVSLGGIWYLLLTYLYKLIFPKSIIEESLAHAIRLTAAYIHTRVKLIEPNEDRKANMSKLIHQQTQLTETHEMLRELLITKQSQSGKSDYLSVRLLIFIQLIEILELAVSNPVDYEKADELFKEIPEAKEDIQQLLSYMENQLNEIAAHLNNPNKIKDYPEIGNILAKIKRNTARYESRQSDYFDDYLLALKNYIKYLEQQAGKISDIKQFLDHASALSLHEVRKKDLSGFVNQASYDRNLLIENFNFKSLIFRHSLRISVAMMLGAIAGLIVDPHNYYWVLMTLVVIMRANYGLTKKRLSQRTIGTIIGAALTVAVLLLTKNLFVYGILAAISMVLALAWLQRNYSTAAIYVTSCVLFSYALLTPDALNLIQFRLLDTGVGVAIAAAGNLFLWQTWEIKSIDKILLKTIRAQKEYLDQIAVYYNRRGEADNEYRLSRKRAFLAISELNASYQRMTQEPKNKQIQTDEIYELILLNQFFLAASATLGTYTTNNPTTPASENFNSIISFILDNLIAAEDFLKNKTAISQDTYSPDEVINLTYGDNLKELFENKAENNQEIEEAHLVLAQLKWMLEVSDKILNALKTSKNLFQQ